jgi:hypothetical protein
MPEQTPEKTRQLLEAECLRWVRAHARGCADLEAVEISRSTPSGNGPNWYVKRFIPELPPVAAREARAICARVSSNFASMSES